MSDSSFTSNEQISSTNICLGNAHLQTCKPFLEKRDEEHGVNPPDENEYYANLKEIRPSSSTLFSGGNSSAPLFSRNTSTWRLDTRTRRQCIDTTRTILIFVGFLVGVSILLLIAYGHDRDKSTENFRNDLIYLQPLERHEDTFHFQTATLLPSFLLRSEKDWTLFQRNLASHQTSLHIKVSGGPSQDIQVRSSGISSLEMLGKPEFCTSSKKASNKILDDTSFQNVSFLHLSDMDNCRYYLNLILSNWSFPKIYHLKLERLLIREKEFEALSNFIGKYNETLYHVEIEECYLCKSPVCDVGLIALPEHDFKLSIKRKREIPVWI